MCLGSKCSNIKDLLHTTALKSSMEKKYGCVIVYRNKVVSTGYNRYKSKLYLSGCCLLCT